LSLQANVTAVINSGGWNQFGLDTSTKDPVPGLVNSVGINSSGKLSGSITDNNVNVSTQADFFNGKPLFVWIFNTSNITTATEMGIFRATTTGTPWLFPTNAGGVGDTQTGLSTTPVGSPVISAFGGFGIGASSTDTQLRLTNSFNVTAVPEPATAIFGLFTGVAAVCFRRRSK
jgi:hypothetical protein